MRNRWWIGGVFLLGALYALKYFLLDFDQEQFIHGVIDPSGSTALLLTGLGVEMVKWLMVIVSLMGAIACLTIMFQPETFQKINRKLETAFSTEGIQDALDTANNSFDAWVLSNHIVVGLFLFLGSVFMLIFILKAFI